MSKYSDTTMGAGDEAFGSGGGSSDGMDILAGFVIFSIMVGVIVGSCWFLNYSEQKSERERIARDNAEIEAMSTGELEKRVGAIQSGAGLQEWNWTLLQEALPHRPEQLARYGDLKAIKESNDPDYRKVETLPISELYVLINRDDISQSNRVILQNILRKHTKAKTH